MQLPVNYWLELVIDFCFHSSFLVNVDISFP